MRQPVGMLRIFSADTIKKQCLQARGDGAARAAADGAVVQLADRRDFRRRAGEKRFVGAIHFIARDAFFDQLEPQFGCQRDDGIARDAFQTRGHVGRVQLAFFYDENILARAFRRMVYSISRLIVQYRRGAIHRALPLVHE